MQKISLKLRIDVTAKSATAILAVLTFFAAAILVALAVAARSSSLTEEPSRTYLGFDRNIYPGDAALPILRKTFSFSSYWLSPPSGEKTNTWQGKRELLRSQGFGFLVLYLGRNTRELKNEVDAIAKGNEDAKNAAASAKLEGFAAGTLIFLDIEEGGRLPAPYHAYLRAWNDELTKLGFHPGVYCSGIPVKEGVSATINTADDIRNHAATRDIAVWAYNVACPPSPGCVFPHTPPSPAESGIKYATVWQFVQSPRRKEFSAGCTVTYHRDGNCYAPGDTARAWFLDVNSSSSADPSGGARQN